MITQNEIEKSQMFFNRTPGLSPTARWVAMELLTALDKNTATTTMTDKKLSQYLSKSEKSIYRARVELAKNKFIGWRDNPKNNPSRVFFFYWDTLLNTAQK